MKKLPSLEVGAANGINTSEYQKTAALNSIAMSLKRIADALEEVNEALSDETPPDDIGSSAMRLYLASSD
jgi:hypothetical protein